MNIFINHPNNAYSLAIFTIHCDFKSWKLCTKRKDWKSKNHGVSFPIASRKEAPLHSCHRQLTSWGTTKNGWQHSCHPPATAAIGEILIRRGEKKLCGGVWSKTSRHKNVGTFEIKHLGVWSKTSKRFWKRIRSFLKRINSFWCVGIFLFSPQISLRMEHPP